MIKSLLQNTLNFLGYKISKNKQNKFKNFDFIIKKILNKKNVNIIDIGANTGQSIERFNKIFSDPKIYTFEPTIEIFKKLEKKYKKNNNIYPFNYALGHQNRKTKFYSYAKSELNSLYKLNNISHKKVKEVECKMITLDNFCNRQKLSNIDILKIDTQGNEKNILKGSKKSLKKKIFKIIEIEVILGDYYKVKNNFSNIEKYLIENNYKLIAIDRLVNFFSNKHMYFNVIYIREDIFNKLNLKINN